MLLALDISTTCTGIAVFDAEKLLAVDHIKPKGSLFAKAAQIKERLNQYMGVTDVVIEEPLMRSNNVLTVSTLMRFNGMVSLICNQLFGVEPTYISSYESRKGAFPELMAKGKSGKVVLFGAYPKDVDKKKVIWEKVAAREPQIEWLLNKKGELKKENFDMSDAYCLGLAYLSNNKAA